MITRIISSVLFLSALEAPGAIITYNWSGEVGTDPTFALVTTGQVVGNNGWQFNGSPMPAGTEIFFSLRIDNAATDLDPSGDVGIFSGGTLSVSIPTVGLTSVAVNPYDIWFYKGSGASDSADVTVAVPTGGSGFAISASWASGTNPWPDPNVLSTISNSDAVDIIGTSPNGVFDLSLASGDVISTSFTEALVNPTFSSIPEPSILSLGGLALAIGLLRSRSRN